MAQIAWSRKLGFEQQQTQPQSLPIPVVYDEVKSPTRWEYHVVTVDLREETPLDEQQLNALGAEGWLLVSVLSTGRSGETHKATYYFLRAA